MAFDGSIPVIDTMIGFPKGDSGQYDFIRAQTKDVSSQEMRFPAEYMFKDVPEGAGDDPVGITLRAMDRHNIERGLVGVEDETARLALAAHPERFVGAANVDPNQGMEGIRRLVQRHEEFGIKAAAVFPAGTFPQVAIND